RYMPVSQNNLIADKYIPESFLMDEMPVYQPITRLSDNISKSIHMMSDIQRLRDALPGIDCGACGAPTCRAFAEDVVCGDAARDGCVICERERLKASKSVQKESKE
ncbi:MAG: ferredoxin, partial [Clostridia bacterium]|nr:ferredoxin [Clostridia bacterium]